MFAALGRMDGVSRFQSYIPSLGEMRGVGVKETSGYGALQSLFNAVAQEQKIGVRCVLHPQSAGRAMWNGVPQRAWSYTLGGYRVGKKWLSYREASVLGRALETAEAREFSSIVRRIATLLMERALDQNFADCAASTWSE